MSSAPGHLPQGSLRPAHHETGRQTTSLSPDLCLSGNLAGLLLAVVDGEERAVQKETAGKKSKRGRLTVELEDGEYKTYQGLLGEEIFRIGTAQDLLGEEIFRDGQSCRTECFSDIRGRIAEAHIRELRKATGAITSDAKRLKTDADAPVSKTDDAPIEKAAVDGTAVTGNA